MAEIWEALPDMPAKTPKGIAAKVTVLEYIAANFSATELHKRFTDSIKADLGEVGGRQR
jgi:hypothetical protein